MEEWKTFEERQKTHVDNLNNITTDCYNVIKDKLNYNLVNTSHYTREEFILTTKVDKDILVEIETQMAKYKLYWKN